MASTTLVVKMREVTGAATQRIQTNLNNITKSASKTRIAGRRMMGALNADTSRAGISTLGGPNSPLNAMRRSTEQLSDSWGGLTTRVRSYGRAVGTVATLGIGAGILGAVSAGRAIMQTAEEFDKYRAILETLEGSSEKAEKSMNWIGKFAATTPFEIGGLTEAFVRARAYGIDPMDGSMRVLGDTAAAMGKDVMQAVEMIADAMVGENERLKEFGVKASTKGNKITYSYRDKGGKEATATADKRSQSGIQKTLLDIFSSKFAGAMERQSKTVGGILSNMADQWTLFKKRIVDAGAGDTLRSALVDILRYFDGLSDSGALDQWASAISREVGELAKSFRDALPHIMQFAKDAWPRLKSGLATSWTIFKNTASAIRDMWRQVNNAAQAFGGWATVIPVITELWIAYKALQLGANLASTAKAGWAVAAALNTGVGVALAAATGNAIEGATAFGLMGKSLVWARTALAAYTSGTILAAAATTALTTASGIGLVVAAAAAGAAFGAWLNNALEIDKAISNLIGRIKTFFGLKHNGGELGVDVDASGSTIKREKRGLQPGERQIIANTPAIKEYYETRNTSTAKIEVDLKTDANTTAHPKRPQVSGKGAPEITVKTGKQMQ